MRSYASTGKEKVVPKSTLLMAVKTADTSRTSTTATNDPDLVLTLESNSTYAFVMFGSVVPASGSAIKYTWGGTATASNFIGVNPIWNILFLGFSIPFITSFNAAATQNTGAQNGNNMLEGWGSIEVNAGGTFSYQWASNNGNATILKAGSYLQALKIS